MIGRGSLPERQVCREMVRSRVRDRLTLTELLTVAACTTYAVMLFGVLVSTTGGHWLVEAVHHGLAGGGGLLVLACMVVGVRSAARWTVVIPLGCATALYPIQVTIGWQMQGAGAEWLANVHLLVAAAIFGLTLIGLIWRLNVTHPEAEGPLAETNESSGPARNRRCVRNGASMWRFTSRARSYLVLTKPRLMWLLSLLAVAGIGLATTTGATIDGTIVLATITGGVLAIGASGTFNHVYERDRDQVMARTADRPVAMARVSPIRASVFGCGLAAAGLGILWVFTTPLATVLTAVAIFYYAVVYTIVLKPHTRWSIAIGGGAGALPALIGWAAVTGSIGLPAIVLASIVMIWTPAHFYNLAILHYRDYERGGYPMLPVVESVKVTRRRIGYSLGATFVGATGLAYLVDLRAWFVVGVLLAGLWFMLQFVAQYERRSAVTTSRTFIASNVYLGVLLVAILIETVLR